MAINPAGLEMLVKLLREAPAPRRVLCLGYPDMLVTEPQLAAICGERAAPRIRYREDSREILRWHRLEAQMDRVAETRSVFAALDIESDFADISPTRGFEIAVDLNQPAPEHLLGRYDLVYDGGTLEHCFNVGQVMRNITAFARVGGFMVHVNPLNYFNHGFFNFNPTFYHDWYTQSGNEVVTPYYAIFGPVLSPQVVTLEATRAFAQAPERAVLMVAARKKVDAPQSWPMQSKYLEHPGLKA